MNRVEQCLNIGIAEIKQEVPAFQKHTIILQQKTHGLLGKPAGNIGRALIMGTNDITGDRQVTKAATDEYRHNYDRIFKKDPILPGQVDPFDSVWNQWIHYSKRFKPTNNEFARWFFDAGVNHQKNVSSSGR